MFYQIYALGECPKNNCPWISVGGKAVYRGLFCRSGSASGWRDDCKRHLRNSSLRPGRETAAFRRCTRWNLVCTAPGCCCFAPRELRSRKFLKKKTTTIAAVKIQSVRHCVGILNQSSVVLLGCVGITQGSLTPDTRRYYTCLLYLFRSDLNISQSIESDYSTELIKLTDSPVRKSMSYQLLCLIDSLVS